MSYYSDLNLTVLGDQCPIAMYVSMSGAVLKKELALGNSKELASTREEISTQEEIKAVLKGVFTDKG